MGITRIVTFAAFIGVVGIPAAVAQDRGQVGITIGYPASVGLLWHATDNVAIRPEFTFTGSTVDSSDGTNWTLGTGISGLLFLRSRDSVRTYVSPRFTYSHSSLSVPQSTGEDLSRSTNSWGVAGSFGAQYTPNARFGVYGEVGIGYSRAKVSATSFSTEASSSSWGTRAGVGVVFYPGP